MAQRGIRSAKNTALLTAATDGTSVRAYDEGKGPVILILHPGMDTGKSYTTVAGRLAWRFRVVRLHRRQYRLDLKKDALFGSPCTVAEEVEHVLAAAKVIGTPVLLFGHSSGGPIALEALVRSPESFLGGMIYEPASVIEGAGGLHLAGDTIPQNGEVGEGLKRARQALVSGRPGKALGIFTQIATGWPGILANPAGVLAALIPEYRQLIPCQIDDLEAMERLGVRLTAYSKLTIPVAMVCGERSPSFNKEIVAAIAGVLSSVERITLHRQGHTSHVRDPSQLTAAIENFADKVFA